MVLLTKVRRFEAEPPTWYVPVSTRDDRRLSAFVLGNRTARVPVSEREPAWAITSPAQRMKDGEIPTHASAATVVQHRRLKNGAHARRTEKQQLTVVVKVGRVRTGSAVCKQSTQETMTRCGCCIVH